MANTPKVVDREALKEFRKRNDQRYVLEGEYSPNTRVGESDIAENLAPYSEQSGATDTTPFVFQSSGGNADIGSIAYLKALRGNTVVFNQLCNDASEHTFNATLNLWEYVYPTISSGVVNHKYLIRVKAKLSAITDVDIFIVRYYNWTSATAKSFSINTNQQVLSDIVTATSSNISIAVQVRGDSSVSCTCKELEVIDLTLMFGAGNEPTTVEEFNRLFPKAYYEYNADELLSCKVNGYKTVGYNQLSLDRTAGVTGAASNQTLRNFEEDKYYNNLEADNYAYGPGTLSNLTQNGFTVTGDSGYGVGIPVKIIAGQQYTLEYSASGTGSNEVHIAWYDKNGKWLSENGTKTATAPNNAYWAVLVFKPNGTLTYTDICFHLTWDGTHTGYKPYETHTYPMPNVELRSAGSAYDELKPDGTLIRRIGVVDLGTLNWMKETYTYNEQPAFRFKAQVSGIVATTGANIIQNIVCSKYPTDTAGNTFKQTNDKTISLDSQSYIDIYDTAHQNSTAAQFKETMSGVLLYYELDTPTESEDLGYQEITPIDDWGTQEFLYDNDITIPVPQGNEFFYPVDYKAFIDSVGGREDVEYDAGQLVSLTQLNNFLKTIAGYDATKTQSLKNVSGTIQWVDEE